jgi:hypothetical protein
MMEAAHISETSVNFYNSIWYNIPEDSHLQCGVYISLFCSRNEVVLYLVYLLQDVAAFSDDNFEVKDWINKTFKSAEAQENRDVCAIYQFKIQLVCISERAESDKLEHVICLNNNIF